MLPQLAPAPKVDGEVVLEDAAPAGRQAGRQAGGVATRSTVCGGGVEQQARRLEAASEHSPLVWLQLLQGRHAEVGDDLAAQALPLA